MTVELEKRNNRNDARSHLRVDKGTTVTVLAYFSYLSRLCVLIQTTASSSHCTTTGSWRDTTGCKTSRTQRLRNTSMGLTK